MSLQRRREAVRPRKPVQRVAEAARAWRPGALLPGALLPGVSRKVAAPEALSVVVVQTPRGMLVRRRIGEE